jgi:hypothetical protein
MQPMIVTRLPRARDFLLHRIPHHCGSSNLQSLHRRRLHELRRRDAINYAAIVKTLCLAAGSRRESSRNLPCPEQAEGLGMTTNR